MRQGCHERKGWATLRFARPRCCSLLDAARPRCWMLAAACPRCSPSLLLALARSPARDYVQHLAVRARCSAKKERGECRKNVSSPYPLGTLQQCDDNHSHAHHGRCNIAPARVSMAGCPSLPFPSDGRCDRECGSIGTVQQVAFVDHPPSLPRSKARLQNAHRKEAERRTSWRGAVQTQSQTEDRGRARSLARSSCGRSYEAWKIVMRLANLM